jgi:hypothetical protein
MVSGNLPATIPSRDTAGDPLNDGSSSLRDYAETTLSVGTGSSIDANPASRLAIEQSKKKRKMQSKCYIFREEHCRN